MVGGIWGQTRYVGARVFGWPGLSKRRSGGGGYRGTRIWGQTRCPVYRLGTFNVKRLTPNVQWGDRKAAWWPGYMGTDTVFCRSAGQIEGQARYLGRATGLLTHRNRPSDRSSGPTGLRRPHMGTDTMSDIPVRNVQRETFNSQLSTG